MSKAVATLGTMLFVALAIVASAPLAAWAATVAAYSIEAGPNGIANRTAANGLAATWSSGVVTAGGVASQKITFNSPTYSSGDPIDGVIHTTADGVTVSVARTRYSNADPPVYDSPSTNPGTASCTDTGTSMQSNSPRPSSLVDPGCVSTTPGTGGFVYSEFGGTGENTTRDAVEFTFNKPVLAFGAWFGDLETRTDGGGTPAYVRLYDGSGVLLYASTIVPSIADQALCGSNTFTGCGNQQTRWIGFVADPVAPVARMVVIVGDDGPGGGLNEGVGFSGPMVATMPAVQLTKSVSSGSPVSIAGGAYDVEYTFAGTNTGGSPLTGVDLVDDLAATFAPVAAASISVQSVALSGGTVTANPLFNGTSDTHVLNTSVSTLAVGGSFSATIVVRVTPGANFGPFANTGLLRGTAGTTTVSDAPDTTADVSFGGTLTITKTIVGGPIAGATGTFGFAVDCGAAGTYPATLNLSIASGSTGSVSVGIPARTTCTLSEPTQPTAPANYSWLTPVIAPVTVTVEPTATATASVTDELTKNPGTIEITKTVTGGPAGGVVGSFDFTVSCDIGGNIPTTIVFLSPGETNRSTTVAVPADATCSVTEDSRPSAPTFFAWDSVSISPASVTVTSENTSTVQVDNALRALYGQITITNAIVNGPVGGVTGTFPFTADCGVAGVFSTTIGLVNASSGSATIVNIPAPSTCVLSEGAQPAAPSGYAWIGAPTFAPPTLSISDGNVSSTAATNYLRPLFPLAGTGSDPRGLVVALVILLVSGSALVVGARRSRATQRH